MQVQTTMHTTWGPLIIRWYLMDSELFPLFSLSYQHEIWWKWRLDHKLPVESILFGTNYAHGQMVVRGGSILTQVMSYTWCHLIHNDNIKLTFSHDCRLFFVWLCPVSSFSASSIFRLFLLYADRLNSVWEKHNHTHLFQSICFDSVLQLQKIHFLDEAYISESAQQNSLVAIFSDGHGGIPWLTAQSCAPRPTKKLPKKKNDIHKSRYGHINRELLNNYYNHQGGILPADSFPLCASLSRRFATKTGFLIPRGKLRIITGLEVYSICKQIQIILAKTHINI